MAKREYKHTPLKKGLKLQLSIIPRDLVPERSKVGKYQELFRQIQLELEDIEPSESLKVDCSAFGRPKLVMGAIRTFIKNSMKAFSCRAVTAENVLYIFQEE